MSIQHTRNTQGWEAAAPTSGAWLLVPREGRVYQQRRKKLRWLLLIAFWLVSWALSAQIFDSSLATTYRELTYADFHNHHHDKDSAYYRYIVRNEVLEIDSLGDDPFKYVKTPAAISDVGMVYYDHLAGSKLYIYCAAWFYFDTSYIAVKDPYVLRHEQVHFDIAELCARRLKKQLYVLNNMNTDYYTVKDWVAVYRAQQAKLQKQFDYICDTSTNKDIVMTFQKQVRYSLDSLKQFAPPEGYII
ncbi:MAG: hypothetical protein EBZ77_16275, partial [Chitinophagia bacterium]|nr:hypothetical protein [Chitinophagia bacterium]